MLDRGIPIGLHSMLLASLIKILQDANWIEKAPVEPATCLDEAYSLGTTRSKLVYFCLVQK